MESASQTSKPKFDPIQILAQAFSYVKHLRLMMLMLAFGIVAGMSYFIFSMPTYRAKSLVYVQSFGAGVEDRGLNRTMRLDSSLSRGFINRFRSERVLIGAGQRMGILGEAATYEDFIEKVPNLRVRIVDPTHLEVTMLAYDPEVVRGFVPAMVEEFQAFQEEGWKEFRDEALNRYTIQLEELEKRVDQSISSLSKIERDQQLTEVTIEQQSLLDIPKQLVETRERIARMDSIRGSLERMNLDEATKGNDVNQALILLSLLSSFEEETAVDVGDVVRRSSVSRSLPSVNNANFQVVQPGDVEGIESWRELEKQKRILETEIEAASDVFLPDHPKMKELRDNLSEIERSLITELRIEREKFDLEYERLKEKVVVLEGRMPEYFAVSEKLGKSSMEFNTEEDMQKMWAKAREEMSDKLAAVTFSEDFDWVQMRFKGHTSLRDEDPVSPSKFKLVMLSLLIGIAGAFGVPTVLNLFDTSASNIHELEEHIGIKGIGIIPMASKDDLEEVNRSPAQGATVPNYLLECFRIIRANIAFNAGADEQSQVVLVTSARPSEGKTTISANLAWAFWSMGKKVLLVDCDLRRGRVHGVIGADNEKGMTEILIGDVPVEEGPRPVKLVEGGGDGFDFVPRGPIIPGTTEILCQADFENLMNFWRKKYDHIVMDCPPVLGLSESASLQRVADGTVMVIRAEVTPRKDVMDAITLLRKSSARLFGFVLNAVDLSKVSNYYQYYYYSAPYYDQFEAEK